MEDKQPDVIIVGGGIGGLSTAYALSREGLQVKVLEVAPEFGEVGAGLQLAPNCTRILDSYGLLDEAKRLGVVPDAMVMRDATDASELTRLDLRDLEERYGYPYMVIHRSDLHGIFLRACQEAGVELVNNQRVVDYDNSTPGVGKAIFADGHVETAPVVIAADGINSAARNKFVGDEPQSSSYVAYRGTVPADHPRVQGVDLSEVVVYVGPRTHFVHYGLRGGEMLNQVYVFESDKALRGEDDWGTPDELDGMFADMAPFVKDGLPYMWRDKWWRMYDRCPIDNWIFDRVVLLGDSAHAPLQYIAQGAIMAIEDGWVLAQHVARNTAEDGSIDWDAALAAYSAVRTVHTKRVLETSRAWGQLWHLDGLARRQRNELLRARDTRDYTMIDWLYSRTALTPDEEPEMFTKIPLDSVEAGSLAEPAGVS